MQAVEQDIRFERKWRIVERIAWVGMIVIVSAGASGLLGKGPLATRRIVFGDGGRVTYDRFLRADAPSSLHLYVPARSGGTGQLKIRLSGALTAGAPARQFLPEPEKTEARDDSVTMTFSVSRESPARIAIVQHPDAVGEVSSRIDIEGFGNTEIVQFIYP